MTKNAWLSERRLSKHWKGQGAEVSFFNVATKVGMESSCWTRLGFWYEYHKVEEGGSLSGSLFLSLFEAYCNSI